MPITKETAIVYRSGNRRFFTKEAAIEHEVGRKLREKYPCECDPYCGPCTYHCGRYTRPEEVDPEYLAEHRRLFAYYKATYKGF